MGKSLADTKGFVLAQIQQQLGKLSRELHDLENKETTQRSLAESFQRNVASALEAADTLASQAQEKRAEIMDFREELRNQQSHGS